MDKIPSDYNKPLRVQYDPPDQLDTCFGCITASTTCGYGHILKKVKNKNVFSQKNIFLPKKFWSGFSEITKFSELAL